MLANDGVRASSARHVSLNTVSLERDRALVSVLSVAAETTVPAEPHVLTAWLFTDEVCQLVVSLHVFSFSPRRHMMDSLVHLLHLPTLFAKSTHSFILLIHSLSPFIYSVPLFTPFAYLHHSPIQSVYSFNTHFQRLRAGEIGREAPGCWGETDTNPKSCKRLLRVAGVGEKCRSGTQAFLLQPRGWK